MEPEGSLPYSQQPATYPYPEPDLSNPYPHPSSVRSILILSFYLRLGLPSGLLPSGFTTKTLYAPLPHTRYMFCPSHSYWFDHPNDIRWGVQSEVREIKRNANNNKYCVNSCKEKAGCTCHVQWQEACQCWSIAVDIGQRLLAEGQCGPDTAVTHLRTRFWRGRGKNVSRKL